MLTNSSREEEVIFASSLGTVFEWYDFYLYGSLAAIIAKQFFSGLTPVRPSSSRCWRLRPASSCALRRAGVRPPGRHDRPQVHLPGHHPDHGSVHLHRGHLPNYASIGVAAPVILIACACCKAWRWAASTAVPPPMWPNMRRTGKRGAYTSWIQTTATLGLFLSLMVILGTRTVMGEAAFADWGWRVPFIVSILLLAVSVWIRLSMNESPAFAEDEGRRQDLQGAAVRILRSVEEPEDRDPGTVRPDRRPGRGLVHGPVLCAVLPDAALKVDGATANIMMAARC
jgi:MFS family permease